VKNLRPSSRPLRVTISSSIWSGRSSRPNSPQPPPPEAGPGTPSPLPRSSTVPAPLAVEQNTPAIRIERERRFAVPGQTPLPTTPQIQGAFVSTIAPPAPAKPSGNVGPPGFARRSEAVAPTGVCSPDCRVVAEGSDIRYSHRFRCLKSDFEAINIWSRHRNDAPHPKSKQNRCGYCECVRHTTHSDCPGFYETMRLTLLPLANNLLPHRLTHYLREWTKTRRAKMILVGMIPLGEPPAATLVAVEEIFLPVVETLEAVEIRVIPTPRQMLILTAPFPTRGNF